VRECDPTHFITVGAIPWALTWPGAKPLFYSQSVGKSLDFVSLHFYPASGKVPQALTALKVYEMGKPIVVEEMFPLNCSVADLNEFIDCSRPSVSGWIGFYWGKTIAQYRKQKGNISDAITADWLEYFVTKSPEMARPGTR